MTNIIVFDKGGRKERINLMKLKKAPRDFLQGLDYARSKGYEIKKVVLHGRSTFFCPDIQK